jgi:hypothetical protein
LLFHWVVNWVAISNVITMSDYLAEPDKKLRFEFPFGGQQYMGTISPIYEKVTGKKFFHVRWWIKDEENSTVSVGADFTPSKGAGSSPIAWTVFPSGIAKDETDCVQAVFRRTLPQWKSVCKPRRKVVNIFY